MFYPISQLFKSKRRWLKLQNWRIYDYLYIKIKMGMVGLIFEPYPLNFENQYNFWRCSNDARIIFLISLLVSNFSVECSVHSCSCSCASLLRTYLGCVGVDVHRFHFRLGSELNLFLSWRRLHSSSSIFLFGGCKSYTIWSLFMSIFSTLKCTYFKSGWSSSTMIMPTIIFDDLKWLLSRLNRILELLGILFTIKPKPFS